VVANWILIPLEVIDQLLVLLLAIRAAFPANFEGRGYLLEILDIFSNWLLLGCARLSLIDLVR
jgi:hypothetical protein